MVTTDTWREASGKKRTALDEISAETRKGYSSMQRAETTQKKQKEKRHKRKAIFKSTFQFTTTRKAQRWWFRK